MPPGPDDPATHVMGGKLATLELASAELVVLDGPDRGKRHALEAGPARIGTASGCDLRLTDPTVSRMHCEVHVHRQALRIVDSGSTNGTFVDGVQVYDARIALGSTLRLGGTTLGVEIGDEPFYAPISSKDHIGGVIGASVLMRRVYAIVERVAASEATVLIQGETGTGKELVARAIHGCSKRAAGPFVAIDCGAIAENLIESELFGHVRGAFSGAVSDRRGLFEEAHGGTLMLDEIGELPLSLQPKLLRALETREIRPVGSNAVRPIDARIVAATNRSLAEAVNEGTFREDLFYRLAVVELPLPPLRARREDIPMLAKHFFARLAGQDAAMPPQLLPALMTRSWPGNVRELRNFVERMTALGWTSDASPARPSFKAAIEPGAEAFVPIHLPLKEARQAWTEQFESLYVRALLRLTGSNVTRAAERAGVNRRTLQRLMVSAGMRAEGAGDPVSSEADDSDDGEPR